VQQSCSYTLDECHGICYRRNCTFSLDIYISYISFPPFKVKEVFLPYTINKSRDCAKFAHFSQIFLFFVNFLLYRNEISYKVKKLLIEAPPAGVRLRKQFCYSRNYNINVVISYIIKNISHSPNTIFIIRN